ASLEHVGNTAAGDSDGKARGPEAPTAADVTRHFTHVLAVLVPHALRRRIAITAHQNWDDSPITDSPASVVFAAFLPPGHLDLFAVDAVEDQISLLFGELSKRLVEVDPGCLRDAFDDSVRPTFAALDRSFPRSDRAFPDRKRRIRHDQLG